MNRQESKNLMLSKAPYFFLAVAALLFCLQSPLSPIGSGLPGTDSSIFAYIGRAIKDGEVIYRDIFEQKGPMMHAISFIGYSIGGLTGIWVLEWINMMVAMSFTYLTIRLYIKRINPAARENNFVAFVAAGAVFIPLTNFFEQGNLTEEYALSFISSTLYIFSEYWFEKRIGKIKIILIGASFAAVFMIRQNMISLWIIFPVVILAELLFKKDYKQAMQYIGLFLVGAACVILPLFIYLLANGAWSDFWYQFLLFNLDFMKYYNDLNPSLIEQVTEIWTVLKMNRLHWVLLFSLLVMFVNREKYESRFISYAGMCIAVFLVTLFFLKTSGKNHLHYYMVIVPCLALPFTIVVELIYSYIRNTERAPKWVSMPLLLCVFVIFFYSMTYKYLGNVKAAITPNNTTLAISAYIVENSEETDTISCYQVRNVYHHTTARRAASKFLFQTPTFEVNPVLEDEYFNDISVNHPRFILLPQAIREEDTRVQRFMDDYEEAARYDDIIILQSKNK